MATYYVRPDGSDSNTGLGSTTALAWQTFGKAFASGSAVVGGDIIYIAPGTYTESITVNATSPTSEVRIVGNPTASQFVGVNAGVVRLSSYNAAETSVIFSATHLITGTSKNYYSFENIHFDCNHAASNGGVYFITSSNIKIKKCLFTNYSTMGPSFGAQLYLTCPTSAAGNYTIEKCIFGPSVGGKAININGQSILADTSVIRDCLAFSNDAIRLSSITISIYNSTFIGLAQGLLHVNGSSNAIVTIQNCLFMNMALALQGFSTTTTLQTYCRFIGNTTAFVNVNSSITSQTTGSAGLDFGYSYQQGLNPIVPFGSYVNSPNTSFGSSTGAPSTDLYDVLWSGSSPDAGAITNRSMTGVSAYLPASQASSTITIAPGSTSQSIELYLGATGLTSSTSGLSARYNRTRTASVSIPLVARTIAQAWTSGGFAEVDATNMPGVYRLDIPDAALAAGADDVTIVVRGASGTNGAVMTVKLSSGGLTEAQTAGAVWNAVRATYPTAGTFGEYVNTNVNTGAIADAVWDEARSGHTTVGTFGQYVNAELVTPVTSAALVRMGPYEVKADGLGASDPLDIQKGAQHGVDIQCVDAFGSGIDITSATVTAKVYNSGATLVDTYACTATYAADGRATFTIDTTVTNTSGTYTATITRTTGASDTQVFGPLRIYVRDI